MRIALIFIILPLLIGTVAGHDFFQKLFKSIREKGHDLKRESVNFGVKFLDKLSSGIEKIHQKLRSYRSRYDQPPENTREEVEEYKPEEKPLPDFVEKPPKTSREEVDQFQPELKPLPDLVEKPPKKIHDEDEAKEKPVEIKPDLDLPDLPVPDIGKTPKPSSLEFTKGDNGEDYDGEEEEEDEQETYGHGLLDARNLASQKMQKLTRPKRQATGRYPASHPIYQITRKAEELFQGYARAVAHLQQLSRSATMSKYTPYMHQTERHLEEASERMRNIFAYVKSGLGEVKNHPQLVQYWGTIFQMEKRRIEEAMRFADRVPKPVLNRHQGSAGGRGSEGGEATHELHDQGVGRDRQDDRKVRRAPRRFVIHEKPLFPVGSRRASAKVRGPDRL